MWSWSVDPVDFVGRHRLPPLESRSQSKVVRIQVHSCMVSHDAPFLRNRIRTRRLIWTTVIRGKRMEILVRTLLVDSAQYHRLKMEMQRNSI